MRVGVLDAPIDQVIEDLERIASSRRALHHLVHEHECGTLREVLLHDSADGCLRSIVGRSGSTAFVGAIEAWLRSGVECQGASARAISPPPRELRALRHWAADHGVAERLADPATVLLHRPNGHYVAMVGPDGETPRVEDLLKPPARGPSVQRRRDQRMSSWEQHALAQAALTYLFDVARASASALEARRALEARAEPPSDPALRALAERIEAARTELGRNAVRRPIGTYVPRAMELGEAPLRLVYEEAISPGHASASARVDIIIEEIEEELLQPRCSCANQKAGSCDHALAALDGSLDVLRDPLHPVRKRLAVELQTPSWTRFLRAFNTQLAARVRAEPTESARLVFKIHDRGGAPIIDIQPMLQKQLKRGGWSVGQRITAREVLRRPELMREPRDAHVITVLTEGLEEASDHGYRAPSRARIVRVLLALAGHPRVFLAGQTDRPARVVRAALRLVIEPVKDALSLSLALGGRRFRAAELRQAADRTEHVIVTDPATATVTLCTLDDRAQALLAALEAHPASFPPESHDDLLRQLQPLQESVELDLPDMLQGEPVAADRRVIVRLSPPDAGSLTECDTEVAIFMRPIAGGPLFHPGEGPAVLLHAVKGRRVSVHRALEEEPRVAMQLVRSLPFPERESGSPTSSDRANGPEENVWSWRLSNEEDLLDLLAAIRALGDEVVVEWPEPDRKIMLANPLLRRTLKLRITDRRDWFGVDGEVTVDGEQVSFTALLEAVRRGRRYVEVGPHRFAAIEDDLRKRVASASDVVFEGRHGLEVGLPAAAALADLVDDPGQLEAVTRWRDLVRRIDAARALEPAVPKGLTAELRPYQVEGFRWLSRLASWGIGGCLADDMGLGKTVQTLALLLERAPLGPALVIAPTSVGPNWPEEAARFAPGLRVRLYRGIGRSATLAETGAGDLLVTSYGLATRDAEALAGVRFATLVLDEAQAIKNALTRRARAVRDLDADFRVALTGTPVENHLGELWSLMRILAPGLFGSWDQFRERFAAPIERGRDAGRSAALARALRPFLLRRAKAEVAPELPARTEIARLVDPSSAERRLYDQARRAALASIASGASGEGDTRFILLAALTRLRRLACHPRLCDAASTVPSSKLIALVEIVRELRETGHRALVFSQFTSHLALVREALDREGVTYAYLDGSTPSEERTRRIAAFQAGGADLFLISLKAGGTGLNLTAADYVIHLDPWWNPAVEDQATDRAHRIGQTRAVTVIRLITRGTIEESVLALHREKRALAASLFDEEGGPVRLSADDLADLILAGAELGGGMEAADDEVGDALGAELVADDADPQNDASRRSRRAVVPERGDASAASRTSARVYRSRTAPEPGVGLPTDRRDLAAFSKVSGEAMVIGGAAEGQAGASRPRAPDPPTAAGSHRR
jgi:superfamily II DNA or RNA helicase